MTKIGKHPSRFCSPNSAFRRVTFGWGIAFASLGFLFSVPSASATGDADTVTEEPVAADESAAGADPIIEAGSAEAEAMTPVLSDLDHSDQADLLMRMARHRARAGRWADAESAYARILLLDVPVSTRQEALLEMAEMRRATGDFVKSVAIYEKFGQLFPGDLRLPSVFMKTGLLYREMGLPELAIAQFYKVMNSSLRLNADEFKDYRQTVLEAQIEIAETYFDMGRHKEAGVFFGRLLQLDVDSSVRPEILFKWAYSSFL